MVYEQGDFADKRSYMFFWYLWRNNAVYNRKWLVDYGEHYYTLLWSIFEKKLKGIMYF